MSLSPTTVSFTHRFRCDSDSRRLRAFGPVLDPDLAARLYDYTMATIEERA